MKEKKKLTTWYFMLIFSLILLVTIVYLIMHKIEYETTKLENHIHHRNLSYIVDKTYSLEKSKKKTETVKFLNTLTDFFYSFHERTIYYKKELDQFIKKRKDILYRFNQSSINIYDLTVIPNSKISEYTFVSRKEENKKNNKFSTSYKQIPFSRALKFRKKDMKKLGSNNYFLCSARIVIESAKKGDFDIAFVSDQDIIDDNTFMNYSIRSTSQTINLNRIIRIQDADKAIIVLKGFSEIEFKIKRLKAHCINFNDVKDVEN